MESFSLTNVPVPTQTPLGQPITGSFKYRVLGYDANTPLEAVIQMYGHRKSEVAHYKAVMDISLAVINACEAIIVAAVAMMIPVTRNQEGIISKKGFLPFRKD